MTCHDEELWKDEEIFQFSEIDPQLKVLGDRAAEINAFLIWLGYGFIGWK